MFVFSTSLHKSEPPILPDISWEELRSTYQASKPSRHTEGNTKPARRLAYSADPPRVRQTVPLPSYGEITGVGPASRPYTSEADGRGAPPSYGVLAKLDQLAIGVPAELDGGSLGNHVRAGAMSARQPRVAEQATGSKRPILRSNSTRGYSPGSRAVSARAAARDAQLSAERALAAAAAASRAADLAAQAAIQAEAEADAEMTSVVGAGGGEENVVGTPSARKHVPRTPSSRSSRSSSRAKNPPLTGSAGSIDSSGGGPSGVGIGYKAVERPKTPSRGSDWSEAEERQVKARADESAAKAKEVLAALTPRGVRPDNSWLASDVRGADRAGGSRGLHGGGSALVPPRLRSSLTPGEERAIRQRAFVKQYSEASTFDGGSEYSLHDDRSATSAGGSLPPYMSQDSGLTSFDDSDFSCADESPLYKSGASAIKASPVSDRPLGKAGVDRIGVKVKKRNTESRSPEPASMRKKTIHRGVLSPKHISEAGSAVEDIGRA